MATTNHTNTTGSKYKKYTMLLTLVVLFLALTVGMLALNFLSTNRFTTHAQSLEVANSQGATSQELSKNLLDINLYINTVLEQQKQNAVATTINTTQNLATPVTENQATTVASAVANTETPSVANTQQTVSIDALPQIAVYKIDEIKKQRDTLSQALQAFQKGGAVTLTSGKEISLNATNNQAALKSLQETEQIWIPYLGLLDNFLQDIQKGYISKQTSDYLVDYTRLYNRALLTESNNLTTALNQEIEQQTLLQKNIQLAGIVSAFLLFFAIVFGALRQLLNSDSRLAQARQQTTDILNTVNEGLFLIDKNMVLSDEYSRSTEQILHKSELKGKTLTDLLKDTISQQDLDSTKLFIEQLYNAWVVEELIQDLNPLKNIRMSYVDDKGRTQIRFLDFNFLRIVEKSGEISKVFVSVVDITEAVHLQEKLDKARQQHDNELEMISAILTIDNQNLVAFIANTNHRIDKINAVLKQESAGHFDLQEKARQIYREMHSLKGEASAIKMSAFVSAAEKLESQIKELLQHSNLTGNDFLAFTINLKELLDLNLFVSSILERLRLVGRNVDTVVAQQPQSSPSASVSQTKVNPWHDYFTQYAQDIANRQSKNVNVQVNGFDELLPFHDEKANVYKDIATQFLKNAIVHGIESPAERLAKGKNESGEITLSLEKVDENHQKISIHDDGQGINWTKIRQKAVELGHVTELQAEQLQAKDLLRLMLSSGISTAENQDEDAGRGVGMDIVRQLAREGRGKLGINSQPNQFTMMSVTFPNQ